MISRKVRKLKHLALRSIYYKLLNTFCIFTYNRWRYCRCDQFQGCWLKLIHGGLLGDKNYCYFCRVGVTYDAEKIENLMKIADVTYNFLWCYLIFSCVLTLIQNAINFGCITIKKSHLFLKNSWFVARYLSFKICNICFFGD